MCRWVGALALESFAAAAIWFFGSEGAFASRQFLALRGFGTLRGLRLRLGRRRLDV